MTDPLLLATLDRMEKSISDSAAAQAGLTVEVREANAKITAHITECQEDRRATNERLNKLEHFKTATLAQVGIVIAIFSAAVYGVIEIIGNVAGALFRGGS